MSIIITNAHIVTLNDNDDVFFGSLALDGKSVVAISHEKCGCDIKPKYPEARIIDAEGRVVMPGYVNCHGHFYGMYSRGMSLHTEPATNFLETLERLWWRLDRALDEKSNRLSAEVCLCDAVRAGTTTIIDHHASPSAVAGSLNTIYDACVAAGINCSLCYETTDRNGPQHLQDGIDENIRFLKHVVDLRKQGVQGVHAMFGLHAVLTLTDGSLEKCVKAMKDSGLYDEFGFHIHVAEGTTDQAESLNLTGKRVIQRLIEAGIAGPNSIFAHCIDLNDEEIKNLAATNTIVIHNPDSNMNNAVGCSNVRKFLKNGITVGLGTDGMHNDMVIAEHTAYLLHKHENKDPQAFSCEAFQLLRNNGRIATKLFHDGRKYGVIEVGSVPDVVITNYRAPTPMCGGSMPWHFMFGMQPACAYYTIAKGKVIFEKGEFITLDGKRIAEESVAYAPNVWDQIPKLVAEDKAKGMKA